MQPFDFINPDYTAVYVERMKRLERLRADPGLLAQVKAYYRYHIADFINDWGVTVDPRVAQLPGRTPIMPFVLFPKQREWVEWCIKCWQNREDGLTEKSRDAG